jgi:hypothetical protein
MILVNKGKGLNYLILSLLAFSGLGLEALLAFLIEPMIYGLQMGEWSVRQNILHWCITCLLWLLISSFLIKYAKNKNKFDIFEETKKMKLWQWITVVIFVLFSFILSYFDWSGFKIIKEFVYNGWLKFIFQYIYYMVEVALVLQIIVFAQKAIEIWTEKQNIPWGGIICALTWGAVHLVSRGSFDVSNCILSALSGFMFGCVYLLTNRDIKKSWLISLLIFVL